MEDTLQQAEEPPMHASLPTLRTMMFACLLLANAPRILALTPLQADQAGIPAAGSGSATATPSSLSWVSVAIGNVGAPKPATLKNTGTASISISTIAIHGANASEFAVRSRTCGATLAPSATCTATITFAPASTGHRAATLSFSDSAGNSPQTVALSGTGTSATASVTATPSSLAFGSVSTTSNGASLSTTLKNGTSTSVTISSIATTGSNAADFKISSKTCASTLAASASCTVTILFKPSASGARTATLTFTDSATSSPQRVALSGTGTTASGSLSVSPTSLSWLSVKVGQTGGPKPVTLTNSSAASVAISSIAVSGANPADFFISSKTCGGSLAASASCTATIAFRPTVAANRTATLVFTDAASNSPQTVSLSGLGTGAGGTFSVAPLNPSVVENATQQFTASAAATWTASCGSISSSGLYTAPAHTGSCVITATATDGTGHTASTTATITNPGQLTVTPSTVALHAIASRKFSANQAVTWSASCGSIDSSGLFTAPTTSNTCTITATAVSDTTQTAQATATISVVNYTVRGNSIGGTALQSNELLLTPANVSSGQFKQGWSAAVDGGVWGQPLYLNGITISGQAHNLLFVTTSNDSVYAFDADSGAQIWKKSFLSTGVTAVAGSSVKISTQTGILGTPVIDSDRHLLYVVAETSENNATTFPHRLHALDVTTGQDMLGGPALISDPDLEPLYKFQRPGLLLANGNIYVAFGSIEDRAPYHGLLFAFDQNTLAKKAVFNVTPTGSEGGIWMSGAAPSADSAGNIYISTGNGSVNGSTNFGESIVKLSPELQELDSFTPFDFVNLNNNDVDLGSGNVVVVPDQSGPYAHELIACGKPTPIYVINGDAMGGLGTTSDHIIQRLDHQVGSSGNFRDSGQPCYNSPAFWEQNVYFVANHDVIKMFNLSTSTGLLSTTPVSKGAYTYQWPGADPVISSNGDSNGIVWTIDTATSTLRANDATDVSKVLYVSPSLGTAIRWNLPTVANGHVYVGLQGKVVSYSVPAVP